MRRRVIIAGLGTVLAPAAVFSQQPVKVARVGLLRPQKRHASVESDINLSAFLKEMRALGYVEGKNVRYETRFGGGDMSQARLDALASELVDAKIDVLVTPATASTLAAKRATTTIPIIFVAVADPVGSGVVQSLARPGGNATGISMLQGELGAKQLELLRRVVPKASRIGQISNPANPGNLPTVALIKRAGEKAGLHIIQVEARNPEEIERAFVALSQQRAEALVVNPDAFFIQQYQQFAGLAAKFRLPAIYGVADFVEAGGLMSYGINLSDNWRLAASYVDKILRGEKPGEMAVQQPTKLEFVVNLRTAKALGIRFPKDVLTVVDRAVE